MSTVPVPTANPSFLGELSEALLIPSCSRLPFSILSPLDFTLLQPCLLSNHLKSQILPHLSSSPLSFQVPRLVTLCSLQCHPQQCPTSITSPRVPSVATPSPVPGDKAGESDTGRKSNLEGGDAVGTAHGGGKGARGSG